MFNTSTLSTSKPINTTSERMKMNRSISHALTIIAILAAFSSLTACQSAPQTATNSGSAVSADLQAITAKQHEYDQLLKEWKDLKPGLTRLLAIEEELNLLIDQLEQLSSSLEQNQSQNKVASTPTKPTRPQPARAPETYAPVSYPVVVDVPKLVSTPVTADTEPAPTLTSKLVTADTTESVSETRKDAETLNQTASSSAPEVNTPEPAQAANFALQVASITDAHLLPQIWEQMINKNPNLLADMEPNFQKIYVKNTDYYRLKIGSFSTQQQASQKCSDLKAAGVDCLVVGYTGSNFAQLTDAGKQVTAAVVMQP